MGLHAFAAPIGPERPRTPDRSYGVPVRGGELMKWDTVVERLSDALNYWVATVDHRGWPHATPIWGVFVEEDLFLETSPTTFKARNLARNPAVAVHLHDGDRVVAVEGVAEPFKPEPRLTELIASAFAAKYPGYRPDPTDWERGGLYRIVPRVVFAWRDMPTATRWRFTAG
jgi:nitroimidazol reductase NimA-like FMN-containing flavoprotein (pyridoxamine 5'-phosphate oxidase superfamily)